MNTHQLAPEITGIDLAGNQIQLSALKGKKVYVCFFRVASCPFCNLRFHQLTQHYQKWEGKVEVITLFSSPMEEIKQYAGKENPPFPVLADPEEVFYKKYGIQHSFMGKLKAMLRVGTLMTIIAKGFFGMKALFEKPILPGDFLIDEEGKIARAYHGKDLGDHISFNEIEEWVNS